MTRVRHNSASSPRLPALARAALLWTVHALLLALALLLAFAVRFDLRLTTPSGTPWLTAWFLPLLAPILAIKLLTFGLLGLHRRTWRYVSLPDLSALFVGSQAALAAVLLTFFAVQFTVHHTTGTYLFRGLPETIFLLDWLFGILLVGGARVLVRLVYEESRPAAAGPRSRLLVIGAGDAAERVLRELARGRDTRYQVVGLLDDAPTKQRQRIHGAPVLGTIADLPHLAAKHQISEVLIAIPSATRTQMQRIIVLCRSTQVSSTGQVEAGTATGLRFRMVPSLADLIGTGSGGGGATGLNQIRDVSVNDILGRDPVQTDLAAVGGMLHQQTVLVSGAGGSIGSEICRTVARFGPARLILLDKAENAVFEIDRELRRTFPTVPIIPMLGDISDPVRVEQVLAEHAGPEGRGPAVIFHAAAHKHVPLAELNPGEAIRNNVFGTKTLADAAARIGVKTFVMISTDKAVNPSSIMGATKRCAELYIQSLARRARTNFLTVRFGNVLGSNGSVVPIFKQQIAAGGPVTVTHPEMRRYFMTIPEASQLVLQAAALGQRGEIFVLDMGQPVRILDLARDLIILSGLRPDLDIPIVFTGLRPGEKLFEELSIRGEDMAPTRHPKIAIWKSTPTAPQRIQQMIDDLEPLQHSSDRPAILQTLTTYIPEMTPWIPESPAPSPPQFNAQKGRLPRGITIPVQERF